MKPNPQEIKSSLPFLTRHEMIVQGAVNQFKSVLNSREFEFELKLYKVLISRNKKAHGRTKYFRQLLQCSRIIHRIINLNLDGEQEESSINEILCKYSALIEAGIKVNLKAYALLRFQASQTYFLSVSLAFMAVLARINSFYYKLQELLQDCLAGAVCESKANTQQHIILSNECLDNADDLELLNAEEAVARISSKRTVKKERTESKKKSKHLDEIDDIFGDL